MSINITCWRRSSGLGSLGFMVSFELDVANEGYWLDIDGKTNQAGKAFAVAFYV